MDNNYNDDGWLPMDEAEEDIPVEVFNEISKEMLMWFVVQAGGTVEIELDKMEAAITGKMLGFRALGSPAKKVIALSIEDVIDESSKQH